MGITLCKGSRLSPVGGGKEMMLVESDLLTATEAS